MKNDLASLGNLNCRWRGKDPAALGNLNCRQWGKLIVADHFPMGGPIHPLMGRSEGILPGRRTGNVLLGEK